MCGQLKRTIRTLEDKVAEIEAQQCNGIYIWKIGNFGVMKYKRGETRCHSQPTPDSILANPATSCACVLPAAAGAQRCANYISLFVHPIEVGSHLPWPFQERDPSQSRQSDLSCEAKPRRNNGHQTRLWPHRDPPSPGTPKGFGCVTLPSQA